ncbi:site-specific integrase [Sporosarcina sp. resist]|uniref:site-specific integrase n=1 Tax=Sporosarcina sp. resist TaxID=2762563 RepID=UPI0021059C4F|nr:site-specific integrase [Sporosarcina sp. resist]
MAISNRVIKLNAAENAYIKRDQQTIIEFDEEELPNYFEKEELALFLDIVKEKGLYMDILIFLTLAYTGMRVGELVVLKWKDINFEKQIISITKTYYNPKNNTKKYELGPPKTKKSRRKVVVDELVINAFRKHKEEQEKLIKRFGNSYYNEGYVFANFNRHPGYPILIKLVETRMARLLKKVDLNLEVTPHSFRHTHTSLLAEAGVGLEEIMDRLGHQDDEVTRKVYLHVTSVMKKEASNKFSELMRSIA